MSAGRGEIGSIADPLTVSDRHCRTCGCTDDRACYPTCSWTQDPLGMGDLCSRCLAIAASVTDVDLAEVGEFPMRVVVPPVDYHDAGIPGAIVGMALMALSGALVGGVIGFILGRLTT